MFINGLHRKSNEKCGFIAAPTDVHFVLMCHIMAKNDQFLHDQGRIFQNIDECSRKMVIAVQVKNLTKKDLTATDEVENPKNPSKTTD